MPFSCVVSGLGLNFEAVHFHRKYAKGFGPIMAV
jgi:hypothetical protein